MINRTARGVALVVAAGIAAQSIYTAGFGVFDPLIHRPAILALSAFVVVITQPLAISRAPISRPALLGWWTVDFVLLGAIVLGSFKFFAFREVMEEGIFTLPTFEVVVALAAVLSLLELTRRIFGLPIMIFGLAVLAYALFGRQMPWFLKHAGFSLNQTMETIWYTTTGVFGLPMSIMMQLVLVFIVFGVLLEGTGAGKVLMKIAFHVSRRMRGGPAHAAIFSSAMFGTMSGSVVANVVGTGTFTIPMTIKRGFSRPFAGGVEAAASTGGQITPPIMGAAAFFMAQITGIPYFTIAVAAILPSLFYYASLVVAVELQAKKEDIRPIPVSEHQVLTLRDWALSIMFVGPIIAIMTVLALGRSPALAGFWAIITVVGFGFLNPEIRRRPLRLFKNLAKAGVAASQMVVAVGALGVIIATIDLTGVGLQFAQFILEIGNSNLFLSLLLTMAGALILGMGMPTLPAYLIIIIVLGPAIIKLGVGLMVIHFFVFYFGVLSAVTPPVAIAAYAAAPIAGSNPLGTAIVSLRLTIVAFIVPFVFVYNPSLLLLAPGFEFFDLVWICVRLALATWLISSGLAGMDAREIGIVGRIMRVAIGIAVLTTFPLVQIAALLAGVAITLLPRILSDKRQPISRSESGSRGGTTK